MKPTTNHKTCLLTHNVLHCKEPLYLNEMLELREPSSMNLRSNHNTWKLIEIKVSGLGFTKRCFKFCALHFYNSLRKTIRQLENIKAS